MWDHPRLLAVDDPDRAIEAARASLAAGEPPVHEFAGVLVDAGEAIGNRRAVREGLAALRREGRRSCDPRFDYLIGTAYHSLSKTSPSVSVLESDDPADRVGWYEDTRKDRRRSRRHLAQAATTVDDQLVREMAWINLGNDLTHAGRFDESYACFSRALPNPVAAGWIAEHLLKAAAARMGDPEALTITAHRFARLAQAGAHQVAAITGPAVVDTFAAFPTDLADEPGGERAALTGDEQFIADHRLHLAIAVDGAEVDDWDCLHLPAIHEPISSAPEAPPLVTMLNLCKADFSTCTPPPAGVASG